MRGIKAYLALGVSLLGVATLTSCATTHSSYSSSPQQVAYNNPPPPANYEARLPAHIATNQKTIIINPRVHAWGAYDSNGDLVRAGLATAGANYCPDIGRPCRTGVGTFRIYSLGSPGCKSSLYPRPNGGAPMPYCMFFNRNQALHGSPSSVVVEANVSHGCVRMRVDDAEWVRYNFASVGTKVVVLPY